MIQRGLRRCEESATDWSSDSLMPTLSTASLYFAKPEVRRFLVGLAIFLAYIITARLGLTLRPTNVFATLVWPPSGIALAALLLGGRQYVPWIALGAFIVNLSLGASVWIAAVIAFGNTFEALIGSWVLGRYFDFSRMLSHVRDAFGIAVIAPLACAVAATIGATSLYLAGLLPEGGYPETWLTWWFGDTLGILIFTPFLAKWLTKPHFVRSRAQYGELVTMLALLVLSGIFIFWQSEARFAYFVVVPLGWAALRTGPRGTTLALLVVYFIALGGTLSNYGPFAAVGGAYQVLYLQLFIGTMATFFLIFSSVVEERRISREALESHVDELENAVRKISSEDEAKNKFLAILAHELRNPLAAILSSVELLKVQSPPNASTHSLLHTIDDRVRATARLLDDLLDVSRISQKKFRLQKKLVTVQSIIEQSARYAAVFMTARRHNFKVKESKEELWVEGDPVRLGQIVVNLLTNAAKYTEPGGAIELSLAKEEDNTALVRVKDSGLGIPKHLLTRIFEPFFQVDRGKFSGEGLGIGLSLTRELVEMHGGHIEAKSSGEGNGSEFLVHLPLHAPPTTPVRETKVLRADRGLRSAKRSLLIAVVDDNVEAADALKKLLELRGHSVDLAHNGNDGVQLIRRISPDVSIVDIGLPDIDGYAVAKQVRKVKPEAFLVALTGFGQAQDKAAAMSAGFNHHLTKPVGLKEIEVVLRKAPAFPRSKQHS